jgi:hypothetical protein
MLTALQAYRDITGQAPIDKVAYPGVYITAACFPNNVYDGDVFESCISNLLSAQYRRFIFDIYWDTAHRQFTFCPAELPRNVDNNSSTTVSGPSLAPTGMVVSPPASSASSELVPRQDNSTAASNSTSTTDTSTTTSTLSSAITTTTSSVGTELLQLGPWQCSDDLSLDNFYNVIKTWIDSSSSAVQARFNIWEFNLNAATPPGDTRPTRLSTSEMPHGSELLGHAFDEELGTYIYTPSDLDSQRRNLNNSWFQVTTRERLPVIGYYDVVQNQEGNLETSNGWPSENYLLFNQFDRFLLTWGEVAEEMEGYNFTADSNVFLNNDTSRLRDFSVNGVGDVTSGCFYSDQEKDVAQVNNSWAIAAVDRGLFTPQYLRNLTACGLAPTLNNTLHLSAVDTNYQAYQQFSEGAIFGWASGEPKNASKVEDTHGPEDQFRCVVLDSSNAFRGHWRVVNCQQRFRAACRIGGQPFNWRLSPYDVLYTDAPAACQDGTDFGVPRTALENTYLYEHILADVDADRGTGFLNGVWINLNSLDKEDCWVTTGPDGSCTYQSDADEQHTRIVLIPSIATLIVLILTALTIIVKCGVNRKHSRQRRLGPGGWEYEGVPS